MPESPADLNQSEPASPTAPRRAVTDWEYRTSYIPVFQVRLPPGLHDRLCEWAKQEPKPLNDLVVEILEEAVCRRGA